MNLLKLLFAFLFISASAPAQTKAYRTIDSITARMGPLAQYNVATIADTITRPYGDKRSKARAIFYWISHNIGFDTKAIKSADNRKADPVLVIQSRKATPLGYANLVQEMCSMANIRCLTVDGYLKFGPNDINNPADAINHSWNVVQLGQSPEEWYYIDAALASGSLDAKGNNFIPGFTSEYFFADKALFNLDHFPDNSSWQLGGGPRNLKDFYAMPVFAGGSYTYGLQKPNPATGLIKSKIASPVSFSFPCTQCDSIVAVVLVIGEEKKQLKPEPMNFTQTGGAIKFTYQFKKEDTYPVAIYADKKLLITYLVEITE